MAQIYSKNMNKIQGLMNNTYIKQNYHQPSNYLIKNKLTTYIAKVLDLRTNQLILAIILRTTKAYFFFFIVVFFFIFSNLHSHPRLKFSFSIFFNLGTILYFSIIYCWLICISIVLQSQRLLNFQGCCQFRGYSCSKLDLVCS